MTQIKKRARIVGGLHGAALRAKLTLEKSNPEKFGEWCMSLTGEERIELTDELTLMELQSRGVKVVPRLKRIVRVVKAPWTLEENSMSKTATIADGVVNMLKALPKSQRDAVIVRIARDEELVEDIVDLATVASRRSEPSRPYREYRKERKTR